MEYEKKDRYWGGFAVGALLGTASAVAAYMIANAATRKSDSRVLRMEDSVQIGRPVEEVFRSWCNLQQLPDAVSCIKSITGEATGLSHWKVNVDGKDFEWEAETMQFIPNEAIGWKSISGPKSTGRLTFSRIGDDTLMHITMNYTPPLGRFSGLFAAVGEHIESHVAEALREFKFAVEKGSIAISKAPQAEWRVEAGKDERATGTQGRNNPNTDARTNSPVDFTRPTKPNYP